MSVSGTYLKIRSAERPLGMSKDICLRVCNTNSVCVYKKWSFTLNKHPCVDKLTLLPSFTSPYVVDYSTLTPIYKAPAEIYDYSAPECLNSLDSAEIELRGDEKCSNTITFTTYPVYHKSSTRVGINTNNTEGYSVTRCLVIIFKINLGCC